MKRRFFSILFVLVLLLTLGLVTSVPAAAQATTTAELISYPDGVAQWSTLQFHSGTHSVYLDAGTGGGNAGRIQLEVAPIPIATFSGASFFVWEPTGIQHGGAWPGAWDIPMPWGDPYINILLDSTGDGAYDCGLEGIGSVKVGEAPTTPHTGPMPDMWVEMEEAYGFYTSDTEGILSTSPYHTGYDEEHSAVTYDQAGTLADWQAWFVLEGLTPDVVGVQITFGWWLNDPVEGVYVDDVTIHGTTYDLEPATGAVTLGARNLIPPPVIGIEVDNPSVSFGDITLGEIATGDLPVTVANTGNVAVNLDATIEGESPPLIYTAPDPYGLKIGVTHVSAWTGAVAVDGATDPLILTLLVPTGTDPGTYTATLVFWATAQ